MKHKLKLKCGKYHAYSAFTDIEVKLHFITRSYGLCPLACSNSELTSVPMNPFGLLVGPLGW